MGNMCDKESEAKTPKSSMLANLKTPNNTGTNHIEKEPLQGQSTKTLNKIPASNNSQQALCMQKKSLGIDDFIKIDLIGQGAFGKVFKVKKKDTNRVYAMKQIEKKQIFQNKLENNIVLERNVLKQSKHPFIVQLKYAFQTTNKIFFVMEFVGGGEFYNILKQSKDGFPENVVKFVTAEVLLGLEYLNTKLKVIYRDLKPENILLSTKGHVKITDFGLATLRKENEKSFTIAGTPEYLAPEILSKQGHSYEVDIWTLGILIYEMINGFPPFSDPQRNFEHIKKLILANQPAFPEKMSEESKDLIKQLLKSNPSERLGISGGYQDIKKHPFFNGIKWEQLYNLQGNSPLKSFAELNSQKLEKRSLNKAMEVHKNTPCNPQSPERNIFGITYTGDGQTYNSKI